MVWWQDYQHKDDAKKHQSINSIVQLKQVFELKSFAMLFCNRRFIYRHRGSESKLYVR